MISDLNMPHEKMSDFVSLALFSFTLVLKPRNFEILIFFDKKMMSDLIMSTQTVFDLV